MCMTKQLRHPHQESAMPIRRHHALITIDGVRALIRDEKKFDMRYDLVKRNNSDRPLYNCIIIIGDVESILISSRTSEHGVTDRLLSVYPGLISHHIDFGQERALVFHSDETISCDGVRGRNDLYNNEPS